MRVILDLDCVLADFVGGACRAWGLRTEEALAHWTPGEYGMSAPLSAALGMTPVMSEATFWVQLNGRPEFWADLNPLPWAEELVALVKSMTEDWHVVTSPSLCESSYVGKLRWCRKFFGPTFDRLSMHRHKYLYAHDGVCLVDDYDANCRAFVRNPLTGRSTGGHAVTFPAHHNHLHGYAAAPMTFIRVALDSFNRMHRTPEPTPTAVQ